MKTSLPLAVLFFCSVSALPQSSEPAPPERTRVETKVDVNESLPNLPTVNNMPYIEPTQGERALFHVQRLFSAEGVGVSAVRAAIELGRDRPNLWGRDFPGYMQRFGSAYGERAVGTGARIVMSELLHEDTEYIRCHGCSFRDKLKNALLAEVTARHGKDGHRELSITPIGSAFIGSYVAYNTWYPDVLGENRSAAEHVPLDIATRFGTHMLSELFFDKKPKPPAPRKHWYSRIGNDR